MLQQQGTLYRVALGEVAFCYDNINLQQQGARYGVHTGGVLTYKANALHMKT